MAVGGAGPNGAEPPARVVTVHVDLKDEAHAGIGGVIISASRGKSAVTVGVTGASGHVDLRCDVGADVKALYLVTLRGDLEITGAAADAAKQAFATSIEPKYVKMPEIVTLVDGTSDYSVTLQRRDGVTVSGRLVDGQGQKKWGYLTSRGKERTLTASSKDGRFHLPGVARGEPCDILISSSTGLYERLVTFSRSQTSADCDIGDIVIGPLANATGSVHLRLEHVERRGGMWEWDCGRLMLIREDCSVIAPCRPKAVVGDESTWDADFAVPPGRYFVAMGDETSPYTWALISMLRAPNGPQAAIDAGVGTCTVGDGQAVQCTFDCATLRGVMQVLRGRW